MKRLVVLLILGLFLYGCTSTSQFGQQSQRAPVPTYYCPDGSVVTNLASCPTQTVPTPTQTYSCPDGSVVTNLSDCPTQPPAVFPNPTPQINEPTHQAVEYAEMINKSFDLNDETAFLNLNLSGKATIINIEGVKDAQAGTKTMYLLVYFENTGTQAFTFSCDSLEIIDSKQRQYNLEVSYDSHFGQNTGWGIDVQPGLAELLECTQKLPIDSNLTTLQLTDSRFNSSALEFQTTQ